MNYCTCRLETERILPVFTPVLQFIPSAVTAEFVRVMEVPREVPAVDGARRERQLRSALCRGRRQQRARAAKRHWTIKRSGTGGTLAKVTSSTAPMSGQGHPLLPDKELVLAVGELKSRANGALWGLGLCPEGNGLDLTAMSRTLPMKEPLAGAQRTQTRFISSPPRCFSPRAWRQMFGCLRFKIIHH